MKDLDIDFPKVKDKFDNELTPGQRAEIRRTGGPEELGMIPAYYRLLPDKTHPSRQWRRVVFLLPHANHLEDGGSIGEAMAEAEISEMRILQLLRTDSEMLAMQRLRRLCQQAKPSVDWAQFGRTLYYWNNRSRQGIAENYFAAGGGKDAMRQGKEKS